MLQRVRREPDVARAQKELAEGRERLVHRRQVDLLRAAEAVRHRAAHELLYHLADGALQVLAVEHLAPLAVDDVALHVHHVVILKDGLAGLEVSALNGLLRALDGIGEHLHVQRRVVVQVLGHHAHHALAAEKAHDVVRQRQEEAALAGVALAAGAAAQLVVDAPGLVPLRAEDVEPAGGAHALGLGVRHGPVRGQALGEEGAGSEDLLIVRVGVAGGLVDGLVAVAGFFEVVFGQELGVAAEHDVRAAAGHVGGDGDGPQLARLGHDLRFALVLLGVEDVVRYAALFQQGGERLALLDAHRAHQHGLALFVAGDDLLDDGVQLALLVAVDDVRPVLADDGLVGGYLHDVQLVDGLELLFLREGRARHAGELAVEAEIVLEGDGGQRLVLAAHVHLLLGLDGLVQALRIAAAEHQTAGELVDDDDLAVLHHVVDVPLHHAVGLQRLVDVVREGGVFQVGQVLQAEILLRPGRAAGGERGRAGLLVHHVVGVEILVLLRFLVHGGHGHAPERAHEGVRLAVEVRALVALAGDDERRARLVYQYGVHLVHDGEGVAALHHLLLVDGHVVAQVVEAHLVVGAVGDVRGVGRAALLGVQAVDDEPHLKAHEAEHLAHPLAVALGKVVVHGDDVHSLAGYGVQIGREDGDERLALAGLHLRDAALVQHDAADELHAEGLHAQHAPGRLAHGGEGLRQHGVQALAVGVALLELRGLAAQLLVREGLHLPFEGLDAVHDGIYLFKLAVAVRAEQLVEKPHLTIPRFLAWAAPTR